jgi:2-polyprenyl-3-methyl-5-hydroxy-6-metoxy-1,4-benzoquinol methylase
MFVLDVGCSIGTVGKMIMDKNGAVVYGIERSPEMAEKARFVLDKVFVGDVEDFVFDIFENQPFDTIILADVLEHLIDPWNVLKKLTRCVKPGGKIIASIPNIRHISTVYQLLVKGYWPYRDRGIHDRTHLRFFTKRNVIELFDYAGLSIEYFSANYRLLERPHKYNKIAKYMAFPGIRDFLSFQYLVKGAL